MPSFGLTQPAPTTGCRTCPLCHTNTRVHHISFLSPPSSSKEKSRLLVWWVSNTWQSHVTWDSSAGWNTLPSLGMGRKVLAAQKGKHRQIDTSLLEGPANSPATGAQTQGSSPMERGMLPDTSKKKF